MSRTIPEAELKRGTMFLRGPTEPFELPRSIHVSAKARLRSLEKGKRAVGLKRRVERRILRNAGEVSFLIWNSGDADRKALAFVW